MSARLQDRTLSNTLLLTRVVRSRCRIVAASTLFTPEELKCDLPGLQPTFGPACVSVQVDNRYARERRLAPRKREPRVARHLERVLA